VGAVLNSIINGADKLSVKKNVLDRKKYVKIIAETNKFLKDAVNVNKLGELN
jgi:hypothetical protein